MYYNILIKEGDLEMKSDGTVVYRHNSITDNRGQYIAGREVL